MFKALNISLGVPFLLLCALPLCETHAGIRYASIQEQNRSNQDRMYIDASPQQEHDFFGIFDGHGNKGGSAAAYEIASRGIIPVTKNLLAQGVSPKKAFLVSYLSADAAIQDRGHDSGTTASTVLVDKKNKKVYVANVGDSPVLIGFKNGSHRLASTQHETTNTEEVARINEAKAPLEIIEGRFYLGVRGLAMSRALGDCSMKGNGAKNYYLTKLQQDLEQILGEKIQGPSFPFWISPVPAYAEYDLDQVDWILMASDGILGEHSLDLEQGAQAMMTHRGDPETVVQGLLASARVAYQAKVSQLNNTEPDTQLREVTAQAIANRPASYIDDMTAIAIFFGPDAAIATTGGASAAVASPDIQRTATTTTEQQHQAQPPVVRPTKKAVAEAAANAHPGNLPAIPPSASTHFGASASESRRHSAQPCFRENLDRDLDSAF